jgi:hypothetical protein
MSSSASTPTSDPFRGRGRHRDCGVLDEITVEATAEGYVELVEFANAHATLRAWAIEGTGGHGAGLSRHLLESSEMVIELDRPKRAARRNSGQVTTRYRLNRYGDRNLNNALHTVVQIRIQYRQPTRDYIARRRAEGKTSREIKRCLARYVARDLYRLLETRPQLLDEA